MNKIMNKFSVLPLVASLCALVGCGDPVYDNSSDEKKKETLIEVFDSLPLGQKYFFFDNFTSKKSQEFGNKKASEIMSTLIDEYKKENWPSQIESKLKELDKDLYDSRIKYINYHSFSGFFSRDRADSLRDLYDQDYGLEFTEKDPVVTGFYNKKQRNIDGIKSIEFFNNLFNSVKVSNHKRKGNGPSSIMVQNESGYVITAVCAQLGYQRREECYYITGGLNSGYQDEGICKYPWVNYNPENDGDIVLSAVAYMDKENNEKWLKREGFYDIKDTKIFFEYAQKQVEQLISAEDFNAASFSDRYTKILEEKQNKLIFEAMGAEENK